MDLSRISKGPWVMDGKLVKNIVYVKSLFMLYIIVDKSYHLTFSQNV